MSETTTQPVTIPAEDMWPGQRATMLALGRALRECAGEVQPDWMEYVADRPACELRGYRCCRKAESFATPTAPDDGHQWAVGVMSSGVFVSVPVRVCTQTDAIAVFKKYSDDLEDYQLVDWHDHERHETAYRWQCPCCHHISLGKLDETQASGVKLRMHAVRHNLVIGLDGCPVCGHKETP